MRRNARVSRIREPNLRVQTVNHWPEASLHRSHRAELPSSPYFLFIYRNAPQCKVCGKMIEDSGTHFALRNHADDHLGQPALPERSVDPRFLMEADILGGLSGATQSYNVTGSLPNQEFIGNSTESALSPLTLKGVIFDDSVLLADTVMPRSNQAVSLSPNLMLRASFRERRLHSRIRCSERL